MNHQFGELTEPSDEVRRQLDQHEGRRLWSPRQVPRPKTTYLLIAAAAGPLLAIAIILIVAGSHPSSAPSQEGQPPTASWVLPPDPALACFTPSQSVPEDKRISLDMIADTCLGQTPVPNPRIAHVPEPTTLRMAHSPVPISSCTAYPDGVLRELGAFQGDILAEYTPAGPPRPDECPKGLGSWVSPSLFSQ